MNKTKVKVAVLKNGAHRLISEAQLDAAISDMRAVVHWAFLNDPEIWSKLHAAHTKIQDVYRSAYRTVIIGANGKCSPSLYELEISAFVPREDVAFKVVEIE
ncbi:hypothetical protein SAMN05216338_1001855 [Bradyrhizobium sp. Rc2d]|uniref:hypothetical protein n=1 Tax=Bradyrhizobium sp. Rc2d TaxID=1855321 RepID=UPI00087DFD64|nr:hypothetical protein [Bradyrhizobium sp. Rc2d]SDG59721.1 hypothetical protein SAMN05216338_1001855 [Bradyrhizobium sp. Rc2d]